MVVSILTAPNLSESSRILARWIQVADQTLVTSSPYFKKIIKTVENEVIFQHRFGNHFAFFNVISACVFNKHLLRWKDLWNHLNHVREMEENKNLECNYFHHVLNFQAYYHEAEKLEKILTPKLNTLSDEPLEGCSLPHILPLIISQSFQKVCFTKYIWYTLVNNKKILCFQKVKSFLSDLMVELSSSLSQDENRLTEILIYEKTLMRNAAAMFEGLNFLSIFNYTFVNICFWELCTPKQPADCF